MPSLFGVKLPQTNKYQLKSQIRSLTNGQKNVLYFYYSEFLLRANRNPWYKSTLNRASLSAIDGKGLHWSMWKIMHRGFLPRLYTDYIIYWPFLLRVPIFLVFFTLQCFFNLLSGFLTLTAKYNFTHRTKNQVILGRDFVYDLLKIAEEREWKTLVLGGSSLSDEVTKNLIVRLFPSLNLVLWTRDSRSLLMRDKVESEFHGKTLNSKNVCQFFPDLWEAKQFIKDEEPDLLLICLGGASGKQEFFIDHLLQDPEINFTLATGLGAAVDHLGGGAQQTVAPSWMIKSGLEWLHRFINQPYRRGRIFDSIFTLWWWTCVQEFMDDTQNRPTVVNIIQNDQGEFLIVRRKNWLPGDLDWSFIQGGINKKEPIEFAGLREIVEEVNLEREELHVLTPPVPSHIENFSVSFLRFLYLGARYTAAQKYLNLVHYSGKETELKTNWENAEAIWVKQDEVLDYLSGDKVTDWQNGIKLFNTVTINR